MPTIPMTREQRHINETRIWAKVEILKRLRQIQSILAEAQELWPDVFTDRYMDEAHDAVRVAYEARVALDAAYWESVLNQD
jgi:hypothetical protein